MHTRRALLRIGGSLGLVGLAGLAGCTATADDTPLPDGGSDGDGDGDGSSQPSDREYPPGATHEARIVGSDAAPDLPVAPRVSLANPYVTPGQPVVVRVDVDNTTDEPVTIGEYRDVVFQYVSSGDGSLLWYPHSERSTAGDPDRATPELDLADEGCWRLPGPIAVTQEYGTVEIPANGTLTAYVGLYATERAPSPDGSCFPTGASRFDTTYTVVADGMDGDDNPGATWGFDLAIEAIDGD
ncbi:hypothetical protein [Halobaculum lipolyticum]|uniref:Uncharacterized protein n=1 Tax=Halobaculum lipolyticum TaxID=3032001 RepID=A0ABD5WAW1_9EURY|nr:hypothetical protein [Halobaculum sp. DT31]